MRVCRIQLLLLFFLISIFSLAAQEVTQEAALEVSPGITPEIMSKAAALYDFETGTLLYEKNGDVRLPPASMTKLMTLHLAFNAINRGELSLETAMTVGPEDDFSHMPRRSSLMFIEEGQRVTLLQLMRGLAVPSGNDAAHMLARLVSGSVDAFVEEMNREAKRLGFENIYFEEPAGLSEKNYVTAKEFALFCREYIRLHPESLELLHNRAEFTYPPRAAVNRGAPSSYGPITQENYNILIGRHPWVDGLKTGYIDESGYNISLSARADGRRVVAVVMGGPGENSREGALSRAIDGVNLISYGFYRFTRVEPQFPELESVRVYRSARGRIPVRVHAAEPLVLPLDTAARLEVQHEIDTPLAAPLAEGAVVGRTLISSAGHLIRSYPIVLEEEAVLGNWWQQLVDSLLQ